MKTSFIATVYNEEKAIVTFIHSILYQTKKPDEIIIVDGGSTDNTLHLLRQYSKIITILKKKGNRSQSRNYGIKKSKNDIILVSDAGCKLDKRWVENIIKPFLDNKTDVVSGYYKPVAHSFFQKVLATYTCVMPDRINPDTFLPSSRSVAFRKSAWRRVGGYPENLDTCEDLVFASNLKKHGDNMIFAKNAVVFWPQRKNLLDAFKQFFSYAVGDGKALYIRQQTPFLFARYGLGLLLVAIYLSTNSLLLLFVLLSLLILYIIWSIYKNYRYVPLLKSFVMLPIIQFLSDIAVLSGMTYGLILRVWDTRKTP